MTYATAGDALRDEWAQEAKQAREQEQRRAEARNERVLRYRSLLRSLSLQELAWFEGDLQASATPPHAGFDSQYNPITVQSALHEALSAVINEKR
jgi:hypothetical protein